MLELRFKTTALAEIAEAAEWFDSKQPGLGEAFRLELERALKHATRFPQMHRELEPAVRRLVLRRFRYCVYYRLSAQRITVQAVLFGGASPGHREALFQDQDE